MQGRFHVRVLWQYPGRNCTGLGCHGTLSLTGREVGRQRGRALRVQRPMDQGLQASEAVGKTRGIRRRGTEM